MTNTVKTSKEQVEFWDSVLDDYEKGIGLPNYSNDSLPEEELQEYLTMNRNVLEKLDIVQCAEIAYRIGQYGFHGTPIGVTNVFIRIELSERSILSEKIFPLKLESIKSVVITDTHDKLQFIIR